MSVFVYARPRQSSTATAAAVGMAHVRARARGAGWADAPEPTVPDMNMPSVTMKSALVMPPVSIARTMQRRSKLNGRAQRLVTA
jgi:hypothetical protein